MNDENVKSARDFYHLLYDLDPEEAIPLMEARDKLIEEAARRRAGEPWLFAIEQIDNGTWKDGEQCVFGDLVSAQDEVDILNDAFPEGDNPYRVVPLFRSAISAPSALAAPQESMSKSDAQRCDDEGHKLIQVNCMCKIKVKPVAEHDREIERKARLAFYAEIMSLRCEPLGRLGMVQALKENKAAASTSSDSGSRCPECGGKITHKGGHGSWCPNICCKWGWETEMDGSPLKPPATQTKEGKEAQ